MSTDTAVDGLARRIAELLANDPQFAAATPIEAVAQAVEKPGMRLPEIVQTVLAGYTDRVALGQRAVELVSENGRTVARLLPKFDTVTYGELWNRIRAVSAALHADGVQTGDRVAILGFTSTDYTVIDTALGQIGAVSVPLQTSSSASSLLPIIAETEPVLIATSAAYVADAVELAVGGPAPARLLVFDHHAEVDDERDAIDAARAALADAGLDVVVETFADVYSRGVDLPSAPAPVFTDADPLTLLIYTSGSTGAPKGAMYPESNMTSFWRRASSAWFGPSEASINLAFMPMSHVMGRGILYASLSNGGSVYFAAKSDLSTLLEDFALVRPTEMNLVPRVWEMLYLEFQSRADKLVPAGAGEAERDEIEQQVMADMRQNLLGGRYIKAMTGSAPITDELKAWVEKFLGIHLLEGYGSTEAGMVFFDGVIQRPPTLAYKLVDVPDLGYYLTDQPYPRGELLVKTEYLFPGYYKRPDVTASVFDEDGFYRTGDVVAELGPDQIRYVDRRNNVLKLAQGEFVTLAKLEAAFSNNSPLVRQIYVYGNSAQPYLLAVVVPTEDALARWNSAELKQQITDSLQEVAKAAELQSYEIPRDFIVETEPFSLENGLLTGIRKLAWPKLKAHYGLALEQLYVDLAAGQADELRALRQNGADGPALPTVIRAAGALLGASGEVAADAHFTDLGGDSLSALTFGNLLEEIFGVEVQVGIIVSPANDLAAIAAYIEAERSGGAKRPSFTSVHGKNATEVRAADLTLDKFLDAATLAAAPALPGPVSEVRTVLLTGATGFLGRYLALEWLERMDLVDGKVIALV
ncbi:MAG: AMP-binding protein, partial [Mycobacterium sp.]|nr:AMP-binding protein [Mycobacterium sp.]